MGKAKISTRRLASAKSTSTKETKKRIKPGLGVEQYDPTKALLDEERIGRAIWECLKNGDHEGVIEVIKIHLNKAELAKKAQLPKTTLYHTFRNKNPTIKTLAKLVQAGAF